MKIITTTQANVFLTKGAFSRRPTLHKHHTIEAYSREERLNVGEFRRISVLPVVLLVINWLWFQLEIVILEQSMWYSAPYKKHQKPEQAIKEAYQKPKTHVATNDTPKKKHKPRYQPKQSTSWPKQT